MYLLSWCTDIRVMPELKLSLVLKYQCPACSYTWEHRLTNAIEVTPGLCSRERHRHESLHTLMRWATDKVACEWCGTSGAVPRRMTTPFEEQLKDWIIPEWIDRVVEKSGATLATARGRTPSPDDREFTYDRWVVTSEDYDVMSLYRQVSLPEEFRRDPHGRLLVD